MTESSIHIRTAHTADVPEMARLINDAAELGQMLPKSYANLYENLRQFKIAERDGQILGVCGLSIIWANLAEVVSLVVSPDARGHGLGNRLVQTVLDEAHELGIRRVMSLTYQQSFFERLGFTVVDRMTLPHKVWADCVRCPKHDACDEIAMILEFDDLPEVASPAPPSAAGLPPELGGFSLPVRLRIEGKDS